MPAATAPDAGRLQPARDADTARRPADTLQARPIRNEAPEADLGATALSREILSSDLVPVEGKRFDGFDSEPLPIQDAAPTLARLEHEPLFVPGWSRAILSAALATASEDGPIDLEALIPSIATKTPIGRLPRVPAPTLRHGVQLLLDRGPALTPFLRDQEWLADQVRKVAGTERVEMLDFFGCPTRRGPFEDESQEPAYAPPAMGTVILAMTDLGIGRPPGWEDRATEAEWLAFAGLVRKAACPLVALVPYDSERWPTALASRIMILTFDRVTAVATVRRLVRGGHSLPR